MHRYHLIAKLFNNKRYLVGHVKTIKEAIEVAGKHPYTVSGWILIDSNTGNEV
jgi:hypothetical protein